LRTMRLALDGLTPLSLLKIPSALPFLGFRVYPGDTPCLTSGRERRTPREVPVSILRIILLLFRANCSARCWRTRELGWCWVTPERDGWVSPLMGL